METPTRDDLGGALRLIRDAGRKVRDGSWDSGPSMLDAVDAAGPVLARSSNLTQEIEWLKDQLVVDCSSWRELCILIRREPTNSDLKEVARFLARHMVDRADSMLAWLQTTE